MTVANPDARSPNPAARAELPRLAVESLTMVRPYGDSSTSELGSTRPADITFFWRGGVPIVGVSLLFIALLRTGWLSDDAYISFRTADNLLNGYGPVWNVGERVQSFTNPLWLALCTVAFGTTGNVYYTAIALSVVVTLCFIFILVTRVAISSRHLLVCFAILLSSKAFIDFSTSGLENPLTHVLLLVFLWGWWCLRDDARRLALLSLVAALCMLNRLDLILILAPPLALASWRLGRRAIRPIIVGTLPIVLWLAFATFYYGTPFPNTAYAKLSTGLTTDIRLARGVDYFLRTLIFDPVTLPAIAVGLGALVWSRRTDWSIAAGLLLYFAYILNVGGDFMMGRFFTAPLVVAIAVLARAEWLNTRARAYAGAALAVGLGLLAPWEPALLSGYGYSYANNWMHGRATREPADSGRYAFVWQIMDERRNYYEFAGLLKVGLKGAPEHAWRSDGEELRRGGRQVVVRGFIGLVGFYAGPEVHIIDTHALSDPLLARLPGGDAGSVIGHLARRVPDGYVQSVATGSNVIANPDLAAYYAALREVVSGPLWSRARLRTTAEFLAGRFEHHRLAYVQATRKS
jgi:arabinofuranosyltransferase